MEAYKFNKTIEQVYKDNPDGFSIDFNTKEVINPKNGFMVGITDIKTNERDLESNFISLLKAGSPLNLNKGVLHIGGWEDNETNTFYLDLSLWVETRKEAYYLGHLFNQKEIYDCKNKSCDKVLKVNMC